MSTRIGLGVDSQRVRAVTMRRGRVDWCDEEPRVPGENVGDCIARLLARRRGVRLKRTAVVAALSPTLVQTRRVGAVSLTAERVRNALRVNPDQFFLRAGGPPIVSPLYDDGDSFWAAAYDGTQLDSVADGCCRSRTTLRAVVPAVVAIAHDLHDGVLACHDGDVVASVAMAGGKLASVRRYLAAAVPPEGGTVTSNVTHGGFADAIGAARCAATAPLLLRHDRPAAAVRRTRRAVLAAAAALSAVSAAVAPDYALARVATRASKELERLRPAIVETAPQLTELRTVSARLDRVASFGQSRPAIVELLAKVAKALPDSTTVTSLGIDSVGGSLVLLTTRGVAILGPLVNEAGLRDATIVGAVTREPSAIGEVQRIAIRFHVPTALPSLSRESSPRAEQQ